MLPLLTAKPAVAHTCAPVGRAVLTSTTSSDWVGPLARPVSLHGRDVSLREALDRIAAAARLRLSYAAELLPLSRPVCLAYESAPAGQVLADLLVGTRLHPVAAGSDQVVLAPDNSTPHRSEEHTSELQSRRDLVCRLLLEKKKKDISIDSFIYINFTTRY